MLPGFKTEAQYQEWFKAITNALEYNKTAHIALAMGLPNISKVLALKGLECTELAKSIRNNPPVEG